MHSRPNSAAPADGRSQGRVAGSLLAGFVAVVVLAYAGMNDVGVLPVLVAAVTVLAVLGYLGVWGRRTEASRSRRDPVTGLRDGSEIAAELDGLLAGDDPQPALVLTFDLHGFKAYNDDFGHEAGDALLARLAAKLADVARPAGSVFRRSGDEFCLLAPVGEGDAERLIEHATAALSADGETFRVRCSFGGVLVPYEVNEAEAALALAEERLAGQRRSRQGVRTVNALVEALSERHGAAPVTTRLESLAVTIGGLLGVHGEQLEALARAAEVHDVGVLAIPRDILEKPGRLDEAEWELVRQHTLIGERLARTSPQLWGVAPIVRATHENWDGTGYPDGLAGEDIPLAARILRVCHAFDAMLSPRPYRAALTPEEALAEIESHAGTTFDAAVVRVLAALARARAESAVAA